MMVHYPDTYWSFKVSRFETFSIIDWQYYVYCVLVADMLYAKQLSQETYSNKYWKQDYIYIYIYPGSYYLSAYITIMGGRETYQNLPSVALARKFGNAHE